MASHVVVVDSTARRATIKTTPGTYLNDVRAEACKKFGLKPAEYILKHNNKVIDLSLTFRLASLPGGAKLDLIQASRSPSVISVALQLPESEGNARLTKKFPSNTSLWHILRVFESDPERKGNHNFTQRGVPELSGGSSGSGRLNYETPVLNIMGRERSSFVELQQTLAQIGFTSGSALIRLSYRNSGQPLEEAMAQISQYFRDTEPETAKAPGAHSETFRQEQSKPDETEQAVNEPTANGSTPVNPTHMEDVVSTAPASPAVATPAPEAAPLNEAVSSKDASDLVPDDAVVGPGQRTIQVFHPPSNSTPQAAQGQWDEADYVPTVEHAKSHQSRLQDLSRNKRLLSDAEIAEQEKARSEKLATISNITLRIRFPDQSQVEAQFGRLETAAALHDLVRSMLLHGDQPFELRYPGPRGNQILMKDGPERLVADLGFQGRTLVNVAWGPGASAETRKDPSLKPEWREKGQVLKVNPEPGVDVGRSIGSGEASSAAAGTAAEGKAKAKLSDAEKENKLKGFLKKGLFKK